MRANKLTCASLGSIVALSLAIAGAPVAAKAAAPPKTNETPTRVPDDAVDKLGTETTAAPATTDATEPAPAPAPAASPLWENLDGGKVTLELDDQSTISGRVKGVAGPNLLVARTTDRRIVAVPTSRVGSIRAKFEPKRDRTIRIVKDGPQNYSGLFAGGGILVGLGATFVVAGVTTGAFIPFLVYFVTLPVAGTGAAMIGAGIPMIIEAKRRRDAALYQLTDTEPGTLPGVTVLSF